MSFQVAREADLPLLVNPQQLAQLYLPHEEAPLQLHSMEAQFHQMMTQVLLLALGYHHLALQQAHRGLV